jgi:hypothetical protein
MPLLRFTLALLVTVHGVGGTPSPASSVLVVRGVR